MVGRHRHGRPLGMIAEDPELDFDCSDTGCGQCCAELIPE